MKKREATKARNRALLLEAGRSVFAQKGFSAARITDITDSAGLAAGTFYKYFTDKKQLFNEIVAELTPLFREQLKQARKFIPNETQEEYARRAFSTFLNIAEEYPELVRLFLVHDSTIDSDFIKSINKIRQAYENDLFNDLMPWVKAGAMPLDQAQLLSKLMVSMVTTLALYFLTNPENLREQVLHFWTQFVVGGTRQLIISKTTAGADQMQEPMRKPGLAD